jgi:hypothetical protein
MPTQFQLQLIQMFTLATFNMMILSPNPTTFLTKKWLVLYFILPVVVVLILLQQQQLFPSFPAIIDPYIALQSIKFSSIFVALWILEFAILAAQVFETQ